MGTEEKIRQLEKEVATLWQVIEDERLWHPSVIREIKRRSISARHSFTQGKLRGAEKVFGLPSSN